jgi:CheY-like chemotaxis protein
MSARDAADLDFTAPPAAAPAAAPAAPAVVAGETEIGPRTGGNFIAFAKGRAAGAAARRADMAADAPIVLVEDDEDQRRLLERALVTQGYAVRVAADIEEFKRAMRLAPLPRLVLLDIELPRVSGLRILAALRQHPQTAELPVIMVTARCGNKDLMHALALGADGYVTKPLTIAVLRSVIDKILRHRT